MQEISDLDALIKAADTMQKINPLDSCIMVCNLEGIIVKFVPAKTFDMQVKEGTGVAKGGSLEDCLRIGADVQKTIPKEAYGVPIKAIAVPIHEEGKMVGAIATGISLANRKPCWI